MKTGGQRAKNGIAGLVGQPRLRLLEEMCGRPQTAAELARRVNTSANAVRVHLDGLRQAGLVDYVVERRGVGKPRHVYTITRAAEDLLSTGYAPTLEAVLRKLSEQLDGGLRPFLRDVGKSLGDQYASTDREGFRAAVVALESLGSPVRVKRTVSSRQLTTNCCPLAVVTRNTPEICALVESLLASASGLHVVEHCVRGRHPRCQFQLSDHEVP